jgi:hypothetical protein
VSDRLDAACHRATIVSPKLNSSRAVTGNRGAAPEL